jgi:group I intron endonuclease
MIMSYIYKITNLITNKIYVGYTSKTLNIRFYQHKYDALKENKDKSHLHNSMRKYGVENFKIEEIYQFDENKESWKELEKYYIKILKSLEPNGYNILEGGDKPPIKYGNDNNKTKFKDEDIPLLYEMLKDNSISYKDISNITGLSIEYLYKINQGKFRKQEKVKYPIRKFSQYEENALKVIHILNTDVTLSNSKIAELIPGYFRANEIASINNGKKYAYLWNGDFPIRKVTVPNNYEECQEKAKNILKFINDNKNIKKITQIGIQRELGYSRTIVEKTLKGIYPYNINEVEYPVKINT